MEEPYFMAYALVEDGKVAHSDELRILEVHGYEFSDMQEVDSGDMLFATLAKYKFTFQPGTWSAQFRITNLKWEDDFKPFQTMDAELVSQAF